MVCLRAVPADRIQANEVLEIGGIFRRSGGARNFPDSGRRGVRNHCRSWPCHAGKFSGIWRESIRHMRRARFCTVSGGSLGDWSGKVGFSHFPPLVVVVICGA